jgi:methionyl-tRNA formyltransferase
VRAFDPVPGAATWWSGERLKIWRASPSTKTMRGGAPGTLLAVGQGAMTVACGDGALDIAELQPASGRRMSAATFAAGRQLEPGARFGAAPSGA